MKITKYFLSMAAAVGMIAGCQKAEIVKIAAPEDVVAPVLKELDGAIEITPSNMVDGKVTFEWTSADYGANVQVDYSLEAALASAPDTKISITSGVTDTTLVVAYENLNALLYNDLKLADGVAEDVLFTIGAKVGEYQKVYSNAITVSCKVTAAEKEYPKIYVVGGFNGWKHSAASFLFDFAGTDAVYQGVIDFGSSERADEGFKITPNGDWTAEWGQDGTPDAEAASTVLLTSGGGNITIYQLDRFYHFALDKGTNTLTKNVSFDQIGVIGDFNSWGADVVMEFNASKQRFYADVEFPADGGFKFRLDGAWDVSYGSKTEGVLDSGDNISVKAGNYRVYLNMNNFGEMTYELNAKMYGQDEPVAGVTPPAEEPEPTPTVQGWGLIGIGGDWNNDIMMEVSGAYWVAKGVALTANSGWKLRKDADWAVNRGAPGEADPTVLSVTESNPVVNEGKNMCVDTDGNYDIYYNETEEVIWVLAAGSEVPAGQYWGLIGVGGDWDNDVTLYKDGDYFSVKNIALTTSGFKIRANREWNDAANYGLAVDSPVTIDAVAELKCAGDSKNITLPADGTYDVYFDLDDSKCYVMTPGNTPADAGEAVVTYVDASSIVVGFSGSFGGVDKWADPADDRLATFVSKEVTDEATYAGKYTYEVAAITIAENDQFKVRIKGDWIGVGGATVEGLTVTGTDNFIAGEAGTYKVTISFAWDGLTASDVKAVFAK